MTTALALIAGAAIGVNAPAASAENGATGSLYPRDAAAIEANVAALKPMKNERLHVEVAPVGQERGAKNPSVTPTASPRASAAIQVSRAKQNVQKDVTPAEGSLYPRSGDAVQKGPLAEALGAASYILGDIGQSEEFRLQVQRAVGLHPVFHTQVSRRSQARSSAKAERAALYPRLSANVTGDYVVARQFGATTSNVVESLRPSGQINAGLSASQLLFDGGATFQRIKSARALNSESEQTMSARVNELALSALSAYYDVAIHQAILRLGDTFIKRHTDLLSDVEERNRLGTGTRADILRAKARLAAGRARFAQIKESARLAEIRYQEFFKEAPGLLPRPSFEALGVTSREEAMALAVARNPEIAAAEARTDGAAAAFKAERASRLPELRANLNATSFDVLNGAEDYDLRAGISMNYDLYAGGARGAAISRARELAKQQHHDEARVRQEVIRDAAIAYERKVASAERLDAFAEAVVAHYGARDLVAERFRVARGDLIDLLQAENDYFEAAVGYLAGLADRDMATFGMMEYTGDLLRFFSPQTDYAPEGSADG